MPTGSDSSISPGKVGDTRSPLPQRYMLQGDGTGGRIKERPEDFIVDELPAYEPVGSGEHVYIRVRKLNLSHGEAMRRIARHFGVSETRIGFAGMKDKAAVTHQTVSVQMPGDLPQPGEICPGLEILWAERHLNKLRRGHLKGNRFSIRIRGVDPIRAPLAQMRLRQLEVLGVPNYFGPQRFGYRANNHITGALLLRRNWNGVIAELLGTTGSPFPEYQRERRELFEAGEFRRALSMWSHADQAESAALRSLTQGSSAERACRAVGRHAEGFFKSAVQSAIFNRLLDQRLEQAALGTLEEGDLAWKHDSRGVFAVSAEDLADESLAQRLAAIEVSPSGPLWGAGMTCARGTVGDREAKALAEMEITMEHLEHRGGGIEGARRPMRIPISNTAVEGGFDEHGGYIRLAFDLDRGAYATVVLREVMRQNLPDDET